MKHRIKQFVVYLKLMIVLLMLAGVAVVIFKNRAYQTRFWPLADAEDVSTLWLMLATSIVSVALFWVFSKLRKVFKELAQLHAEQQQRAQLSEHEKLKAQLAEQERRIDDKIKKALKSNGKDVN